MKSFRITQSITDRQDASLGLYFKDVSRFPLLSQEEEIKIARKAKEGDQESINKLVEHNLRFVISVAKSYQGKGLPLIDLIQEGTIGLIDSIKKYNPDKGYKFISYAVWWIRQAIMKALSGQCRTIRVPINQLVSINKVNRASEKFEQLNGIKPTLDELENLVNIDLDKVNTSSLSKVVSLDTPFSGEDVSCLLDVVPDSNSEEADNEAAKNDIVNAIENVLSKLSYRDRDILRMSFGIGIKQMSSEEIGNLFGIGSERVRQIQHNAIRYIRKHYIKDLNGLL